MTRRNLGVLLVLVGLALIGLAWAFGDSMRVLGIALGGLLFGAGFFVRRTSRTDDHEREHEHEHHAAPGQKAMRLSPAAKPQLPRNRLGETESLHQAFAVARDGNRLRAVSQTEIDARFEELLARWAHIFPRSGCDLAHPPTLDDINEMAPALHRDIDQIQAYLESLVFRRQSSQEYYFLLLDELADPLRAVGGRPPGPVAIIQPRNDFFDIWQRPNARKDDAGGES